jgi:membrane protein implicated in regulation of membrane protease activity
MRANVAGGRHPGRVLVERERVLFVLLGALGVSLLLVSLLLGGEFESGDLGGFLPESDWLSTIAAGAFLSAFGLAGFLAHNQFSAPMSLAAGVGGLAGVALTYPAVSWSRSLSKMATDATPTTADLIGRPGRVITDVLPESSGEVLVRVGGQQLKLTAILEPEVGEPLGLDAEVVVVDTVSATRVVVQPAEEFWGSSNNERKQL